MKKIRRILLVMLLTVAMVVPMAAPVYADPLIEGLLNELEYQMRENARLREQIREAEELQRVREPVVQIASPQNIIVEPGDVQDVTVVVRNIGSDSAHSFLTSAVVSDGSPFSIEFLNNSNRFGIMGTNTQRNMIMRITVDENAEPGTTGTITFTHRYNSHQGAPHSSTDTILVRIMGEIEEEDDSAPTVRLVNFQSNVSTLGADQSFTVTATLQNTGDAPADNVRITIADMNAELLILTSDLNQAAFDYLEPGESTQVSFSFRTARDISSSFTTVDFRVSYDGVAENRPITPFPVTIIVIPEEYDTVSPNVEIRELDVPTGRLNVGETGLITFELVNTGDTEAHAVRITATPLTERNLVPSLTPIQTIQTFGVGETRSFTFGFMPTTYAGTHHHPIQLRVEYEIRDGNGEPTPFVQYVGLNVYNPEPEEEEDEDDEPDHGRRQIPRIIVSAYTLYPQIPRAGQNFEMEITFLNTSGTRSVNNIRITMDAPPPATGAAGTVATGGDSVFVPVGGSNTLFIPFLAPGESITRTVTMFTVPDAAPRIYTLLVNLDYQDEEYYLHDEVERLSVPVAQDSRLETRPPEVFIMPFMDMFGFVDFEFDIINSGRVNLRNLRVRVDGNFDVSQANDYLGNLQQGRVVNFRGRIFPSEPGMQEGAIVVYAEDDAGDIVELVHAFTIDVQDGGGFGEFDDGFIFGDDMWLEGGAERRPGYFNGGYFGEYYYGDEEGGIVTRLLRFIRRPVFWIPAAVVLVGAVALAVILVRRRGSKLDFED